MKDAVTQGWLLEDLSYSPEGHEQGISQIVSRFVNKLSDVTNAMDVSASLSIKAGTIPGSASSQCINSDQFKTSDLHLFIQVEVIKPNSYGS